MTRSGTEAVSRLVLDTSAFSWMRAGDERVLSTVAAADGVFLPVIVLGELEAGFELGSRQLENRRLLAELLAEPFVTVLPATPAIARRYGEIFARLQRAGTPIPLNDVWIAATTLDCGGHLLTFDRHFRAVTGLPATVLEPSAAS